MTASQTLRVGVGLAAVAMGLLASVACGGAVSKGNGTLPEPADAQTTSGSGGGSASSSGAATSSGSGPTSSGGSASSSGAQVASSGGSSTGGAGSDGGSQTEGPSDAPIDVYLQPAPTGLAGFAFVVNGVEQTPLACPAESWEYPPPAAQLAQPGQDAGPQDTVCNGGTAPCPGLHTVLINTGQFAVAYTAQTTWQVGGGSGEPPGVPFGNMGELSGVLNPGDQVDITSVYVGGITAVLGSSHPFVDPDAGKYVADGAMIPWPAGVAGSDGASQMYVAEIEILDACRTPTVVW